ncbi:helix-turn-helix domain-containing protein [Actinoplanes sp. NPDC026619]|uniref:TetR/AcrR family transcriptional regulator n=1 Tax=Actinoplanes sp. NPDC026619 TaxID=3155798 RepID=UPI0033D7004C
MTDKPLRRDAELNRQRIIEAAREVYAARGLAATFDDIAQHAGVGIGTVYRRFPTKEALLEVALEERLEDHVRVAEEALGAADGWAGLTTFLRRAAEMHAADRGLRDVALGADFDVRHVEKMRERVEPLIRRLVERARADGSVRADLVVEDLPLLLMMVSELAYHSHAVRPDLYTRYLQLLIDGLRPAPEAGDLGRPPSADDLETLARHWLPSARR